MIRSSFTDQSRGAESDQNVVWTRIILSTSYDAEEGSFLASPPRLSTHQQSQQLTTYGSITILPLSLLRYSSDINHDSDMRHHKYVEASLFALPRLITVLPSLTLRTGAIDYPGMYVNT